MSKSAFDSVSPRLKRERFQDQFSVGLPSPQDGFEIPPAARSLPRGQRIASALAQETYRTAML
eukprot:8555714-Pyramimonas_sp.AAC.2